MDDELKEMMEALNRIESDLIDLNEQNDVKYNKILTSSKEFANNIEQIEYEFDRLTGLQKEDYIFILLCAGLQACRQYLITDFDERLSDKEAAKEIKGDKTEHSNRNKVRYYCSIDKMIVNPVPFDAVEHKANIKSGICGVNHRVKCLGHYPILGYVFGTANIMTSTVTVKEGIAQCKTYHVKTEPIEQERYYKKTGESRIYVIDKDYIYAKAHTSKMFNYCYERIKKNPKEGFLALVTALRKEHEHLRSDEKTKQSLPFPVLSFTPEIAEKLSEYGLDYINLKTVAKQASYSCLVNLIIAVIYYAYQIAKNALNAKSAEEAMQIDDKVRVRLKKILNVANVISTSTNLVVGIVGLIIGNTDLIKKLDIGGELVTLYSLSSSADFILQVKQEYVLSEIQKID